MPVSCFLARLRNRFAVTRVFVTPFYVKGFLDQDIDE